MTKAQAHPAEFKGKDLKSEKDFFYQFYSFCAQKGNSRQEKSLVCKDFYVGSDWRNKTFKLILDS